MRSITSVDIENFQVHEKLTVNFSKYTVITGPSNKGKTAVIRAINWCLYNSPSGSDFITKGKNKCIVSVTFSDGLIIRRSKGSNINSYDIIPPGEEIIHLEGFGIGPVDEVIRAHGMFEIDFFGEKQSLNLCKQLSQPFFLGESPTTKALMIGKLGKTDVIDLSIKNTTSDIRIKKANAKEYKEELKEVKSELSELKGLSIMEKAIGYADKRLEKIEYIDSKIKNISSATTKIKYYSDKQEELEKIVSKEIPTEESLELINRAIEINSILVSIKRAVAMMETYQNKLRELEDITNICSSDDVDNVIATIDNIIELTSNINSIKQKMNKIKNLEEKKFEFESLPNEESIDNIISNIQIGIQAVESLSKIRKVNDKYRNSVQRKEKGEAIMAKLNNEYEESVTEYKSGLMEAKMCPICMSTVTEDHMKNIEDCM